MTGIRSIKGRGIRAFDPGCRIDTALGQLNVFDHDGTLRTFSQSSANGTFRGARRIGENARGPILSATSPDQIFPLAYLAKRTASVASMGYVLEPGHDGFCVIIIFEGQSNVVGATSAGTTVDTVITTPPINVLPPKPGRMRCFVGGINPGLYAPSGGSATREIDAASYASIVDACDAINPFVQRDTMGYSMGLILADAFPDEDEVMLINMALGSTGYGDRIYPFQGSRASGTVTITAGVASFTVTSGSVAAVANLIIVGAGITAGNYINGAITGTPTGSCSAPMLVADTVGPVAFTTRDRNPAVYRNYETTLTAAAADARARNKTPVLVFIPDVGGENENDILAPSNGVNNNANKRTALNALAALVHGAGPNAAKVPHILIGMTASPRYQTNHDPALNETAPYATAPILTNMGLVNNQCLAAGLTAWGRSLTTGVRYDLNSSAITLYDCEADAEGRVHFVNLGHIQMGEKFGLHALDVIDGNDGNSAYITEATRVVGSSVVNATMTEPGGFSTTVCFDTYSPGVYGRYGFDYRDSGVWKEFDTITALDDNVAFTFATEPSGSAEELWVACGNSPLKIEYTSRDGNGMYPWTNRVYGVGRRAGQRACWMSTTPIGYGLQSGRPYYKFAQHQKVWVKVNAGGGTVADMTAKMATSIGLTSKLIVDFDDPVSYPGSGQVLTDRSAAAMTFDFGIDSGIDAANDPVYVAAAGAVPGYAEFSGGDRFTPVGSHTFADDFHKNNAGGGFTFAALIWVPLGALPEEQFLYATCRDETGGGPGIGISITTALNFNYTVRFDATNSFAFNKNMGAVTQGAWNLVMFGIDETNSHSWAIVSGAYTYTAQTTNTFAATYSTPTASAKQGGNYIGSNYSGTYAFDRQLMNTFRINCLAFWNYKSELEMLPMARSISARAAIPMGE